jgi:hypothetical protein
LDHFVWFVCLFFLGWGFVCVFLLLLHFAKLMDVSALRCVLLVFVLPLLHQMLLAAVLFVFRTITDRSCYNGSNNRNANTSTYYSDDYTR